jgi:hypothetical protein
MGTSHILYLYDDALTPARDDPSLRDSLALDLGRAILGLTLDPDYLTDDDAKDNQPQRLTWTRVGSHGNALHWCDEVHSGEVRVYVWAGNCLRELGELDKSLTPALRDVIERTLAVRSSGR